MVKRKRRQTRGGNIKQVAEKVKKFMKHPIYNTGKAVARHIGGRVKKRLRGGNLTGKRRQVAVRRSREAVRQQKIRQGIESRARVRESRAREHAIKRDAVPRGGYIANSGPMPLVPKAFIKKGPKGRGKLVLGGNLRVRHRR